MTFDPDAIYNQVIEAGDDWADKKAAYEALSDNTKSVLADLTSNYMDGNVSRTEAEMRALACGDYKHHLATVSATRKAFLKAQVRYDSLKMLAELKRSQESSRRQEMRL